MRHFPNFYKPTEDDHRTYRLWLRWLAVAYGSIVLVVVALLALRANLPANQAATPAAAAVASAGDPHTVARSQR